MKRLVFVLMLFLSLAMMCEAQGKWQRVKLEGDKVEGIEPTINYRYSDGNITLYVCFDQKFFTLIHYDNVTWKTSTASIDGMNCQYVTPIIATFDKSQKRTHYFNAIVGAVMNGGMMFHTSNVGQEDNEQESINKLLNYIINDEGSIVLRFIDKKNNKNVDYEFQTIKSLGYEDTVNN